MAKQELSQGQIEAIGSILRQTLNTKNVTFLKSCCGGMVNQNCVFQTDRGDVFVKVNHRLEARQMFDGEFASLQELRLTGVVRVPKPIKVIDLPDGGAAFVMEYLELSPLLGPENFAKLGKHIAQLHLENERRRKTSCPREGTIPAEADRACVEGFGFEAVTSCGFILQDTGWTNTWLEYWARKMRKQVLLLESNFGQKEVVELWNQLEPKLAKFFQDIEVKPCLLHADLWEENLGLLDGEIVVFDPGCFYGHSEFDLSLPSLCDNPDWKEFFSSYHSLIPQPPGFEDRRRLYQLYHHINHWNHFPPGSKDGGKKREDKKLALTTLQELLTCS